MCGVSTQVARQQPCGGIQEWLGTPGQCDDCPPGSTDAYGTSEAPLTQTNGDTITDQLYGNNYGFFSLWEAYKYVLLGRQESFRRQNLDDRHS